MRKPRFLQVWTCRNARQGPVTGRGVGARRWAEPPVEGTERPMQSPSRPKRPECSHGQRWATSRRRRTFHSPCASFRPVDIFIGPRPEVCSPKAQYTIRESVTPNARATSWPITSSARRTGVRPHTTEHALRRKTNGPPSSSLGICARRPNSAAKRTRRSPSLRRRSRRRRSGTKAETSPPSWVQMSIELACPFKGKACSFRRGTGMLGV